VILDIGCGASPIGTVNLDLFHSRSPHTPKTLNPRECPNFIIGDAYNLPIKSSSFDLVHASHLLEHLLIPTNCISEVRRVTRQYAIFKVPNNPPTNEYHEHLYSWSIQSLESLLKKYFSLVDVQTNTNLINLQNRKIFSMLPFSIRRGIIRNLSKRLALELLAICDKINECSLDTRKRCKKLVNNCDSCMRSIPNTTKEVQN